MKLKSNKRVVSNEVLMEEASVISELTNGSIITTIRPAYNNTVHRYMLVKDASLVDRPYRLISLDGGTILSAYCSSDPTSALSHLKGMGLVPVAIQNPGRHKYLEH